MIQSWVRQVEDRAALTVVQSKSKWDLSSVLRYFLLSESDDDDGMQSRRILVSWAWTLEKR